jgi:UDP-N-acetylmuramoyl-L-alanyl-D-glutamate--2,6-diaminopimelate ligase
MGRVAAELADRAIVTTDNPRSEDPLAIAQDVAADGGSEIVLDRRAAIELALTDAGEGDVVVIAGKGADTEMEIATGNLPFDDRAVAREVLT